jgi:acetolactate synthase-1/2/3 large subunit
MATQKLTGGEALVVGLQTHGVEVVFGIPGTHNLPIYAGLARFGLRHVATRHEQGAGFAADGWARVTGRPGVCITTTGPALLNAATAAVQAYSDSVPMLLVSPGLPLTHPALGNGYLHEVKSQCAAFDALVAYSHRVTSIEEIPLAVAVAFASMATGRPRPVHLEIPLDLLAETANVGAMAPLRPALASPEPDQVAVAVEALSGAQRPLILVGGGAGAAAGEVLRLAERLGAPVVTSTNGKGTFPDGHPLAIGACLSYAAVRDLEIESDVILAIATELAPSDLWDTPLAITGTLIRIDIDAASISTNATADVAIIADSRLALQEILARMPDGAPASGAHARALAARTRFVAQARVEGGPWLGIVEALGQCLGRRGILAGDSTMACYFGALPNLPSYEPRSFLYPTGLGTLGYGLPAAIGAKIARPDAPVVALLGDGGVMFTIAELHAAAQLRLPLPVIVVDNGGYGEIRREMVARNDSVQAVDFDAPDFAALARALGCHGVRVDDERGLAQELNKALGVDRPTLLHVREGAS